MNFGEWMNSKVKNMKWWDVSLIKLSTAAFILLIAKLWTPILSLDWYWYLLIAVIAVISPFYKFYLK